MACLLALLAGFFPRVALLVLWLARPMLVTDAFGHSYLVPVLGIIFLPFTTLIYVLLYRPGVGVTGWEWLWVGLAFIFDLAHWIGGYSQRTQAQRYSGSAGA
jgi:hypothetical protein